MPTIKVKQVPQKKVSPEDVLYSFCYYFPQYTYKQARQLPYKRVHNMLATAKKERARWMLDLARVMSGVNSKSGSGNMLSYFKKILEE